MLWNGSESLSFVDSRTSSRRRIAAVGTVIVLHDFTFLFLFLLFVPVHCDSLRLCTQSLVRVIKFFSTSTTAPYLPSCLEISMVKANTATMSTH